MQHPQDNTHTPPPPIVIPYVGDDGLEHQPPYYFCADTKGCNLCREDVGNIRMLIAMLDAGEITWAQAIDIYHGKQAQP
jgi:hypothetical protein